MGSYSPVPQCPPDVASTIVDEALAPMVRAAADAGSPFVGALYAGVALTTSGAKVVEFNARFGDPETQALMPRLSSDLAEACAATAAGELEGVRLRWSPRVCVSVVLASGGYPGRHGTGFPISGIEEARSLDGVEVFCAGVAEGRDGLVTAGGRVLAVSALGDSYAEARALAYIAARRVEFENRHMRSDIAGRAAEPMEGE
jgi:phosphoribosylamine--glycine ligase